MNKMSEKAKRTCVCGLAENNEHRRPEACEGCDICGTNYQGETLEEHQPEPVFDELTGEVDYIACSVCGEWISHA